MLCSVREINFFVNFAMKKSIIRNFKHYVKDNRNSN